MDDLDLAAVHVTSLTNLAVLRSIDVPLRGKKFRFAFGRLGCTISRLLLGGCEMNIDCITSFLYPFMDLEDLSLLDPHPLPGLNIEYPPKPPSRKRIKQKANN